MKDKEAIKDVVCGMLVDPASFATQYQGSHFAFCSAQCRERFLANPHLYVGVPGRPAPKQSGQKVLKRRRFVLDERLTTDQADAVRAQVGALMGIEALEVRGGKSSSPMTCCRRPRPRSRPPSRMPGRALG